MRIERNLPDTHVERYLGTLSNQLIHSTESVLEQWCPEGVSGHEKWAKWGGVESQWGSVIKMGETSCYKLQRDQGQ